MNSLDNDRSLRASSVPSSGLYHWQPTTAQTTSTSEESALCHCLECFTSGNPAPVGHNRRRAMTEEQESSEDARRHMINTAVSLQDLLETVIGIARTHDLRSSDANVVNSRLETAYLAIYNMLPPGRTMAEYQSEFRRQLYGSQAALGRAKHRNCILQRKLEQYRARLQSAQHKLQDSIQKREDVESECVALSTYIEALNKQGNGEEDLKSVLAAVAAPCHSAPMRDQEAQESSRRNALRLVTSSCAGTTTIKVEPSSMSLGMSYDGDVYRDRNTDAVLASAKQQFDPPKQPIIPLRKDGLSDAQDRVGRLATPNFIAGCALWARTQTTVATAIDPDEAFMRRVLPLLVPKWAHMESRREWQVDRGLWIRDESEPYHRGVVVIPLNLSFMLRLAVAAATKGLSNKAQLFLSAVFDGQLSPDEPRLDNLFRSLEDDDSLREAIAKMILLLTD